MNSVRILSVDQTGVRKALEEYVRGLKKRPEVMEVYLCGSWARGTYTPYSDIDILILVRESSQHPYDRIPAYLPDRFPLSMDLFVYTGEELGASEFARKLLSDAIRL